MRAEPIEVWVPRNPARRNAGLHLRPVGEAARAALADALAAPPHDIRCEPRTEMHAEPRVRVLRELALRRGSDLDMRVAEGRAVISLDEETGRTLAAAVREARDHGERLFPGRLDGREGALWIWWPA